MLTEKQQAHIGYIFKHALDHATEILESGWELQPLVYLLHGVNEASVDIINVANLMNDSASKKQLIRLVHDKVLARHRAGDFPFAVLHLADSYVTRIEGVEKGIGNSDKDFKRLMADPSVRKVKTECIMRSVFTPYHRSMNSIPYIRAANKIIFLEKEEINGPPGGGLLSDLFPDLNP